MKLGKALMNHFRHYFQLIATIFSSDSPAYKVRDNWSQLYMKMYYYMGFYFWKNIKVPCEKYTPFIFYCE